MEFGHRVWKFYSPRMVENMPPIEFALILQLILEGLKALKKDKIEELEKEWKKNEQELLAAIECGDAVAINRILAKLRSL
jgi:hypothetical protein